jgi:hypothetical protein
VRGNADQRALTAPLKVGAALETEVGQRPTWRPVAALRKRGGVLKVGAALE